MCRGRSLLAGRQTERACSARTGKGSARASVIPFHWGGRGGREAGVNIKSLKNSSVSVKGKPPGRWKCRIRGVADHGCSFSSGHGKGLQGRPPCLRRPGIPRGTGPFGRSRRKIVSDMEPALRGPQREATSVNVDEHQMFISGRSVIAVPVLTASHKCIHPLQERWNARDGGDGSSGLWPSATPSSFARIAGSADPSTGSHGFG